MKVRISKTPEEDELDGVRLDTLKPGAVREVSPSIGSWLIAERYAVPEMRSDVRARDDDFLGAPAAATPERVNDCPRRRRNDWR